MDGDVGGFTLARVLSSDLFIRFSVNKISRAARRNSRALNEANPLSSSRTPTRSRGFRDARHSRCARRNLARVQDYSSRETYRSIDSSIDS